MSTEMTQRGRRAALLPKGRPDTATLLAAVLPLLTLGGALLVVPRAETPEPHPPTEVALVHLDRGCPRGLSGPGEVTVANAAGVGGQAELRSLAGAQTEPEALELPAGAVTTGPVGAKPVLVSAEGDAAIGLLAARGHASPLASVPCPVPTSQAWFTGLGARSDHASVLEIDNPDVGAAVVDVVLYSRQGVVSAPDVRGIRIPGRTSVTVDLAATIPRRGDVAVQVAVSRGRAAVTALDSSGRPGDGLRSEWLPAQPEPATANLVLGLPGGKGSRTLSVANPGESEAVVSLQVVTPSTTFTPAGVEEFRVRPGALVGVPLRAVLGSKAASQATGLLVESSEPVTAAIRSRVDGDLALAAAATPISAEGAALVPAGTATLVLSGATTAGTVDVVVRDASGASVLEKSVEVSADLGAVLELPRGSAVVDLRPVGASVFAVVVVTARTGSTVVPVTEVQQHSLLPYVGPALP